MKALINSEEEFIDFLREKSNNSNIQKITDYYEINAPIEYPCIIIYTIDEVCDFEKEDPTTEYFIDVSDILYQNRFQEELLNLILK